MAALTVAWLAVLHAAAQRRLASCCACSLEQRTQQAHMNKTLLLLFQICFDQLLGLWMCDYLPAVIYLSDVSENHLPILKPYLFLSYLNR